MGISGDSLNVDNCCKAIIEGGLVHLFWRHKALIGLGCQPKSDHWFILMVIGSSESQAKIFPNLATWNLSRDVIVVAFIYSFIIPVVL